VTKTRGGLQVADRTAMPSKGAVKTISKRAGRWLKARENK
jgi:hypothetical protein